MVVGPFLGPFSRKMCGFHWFLQGIRGLREFSTVSTVSTPFRRFRRQARQNRPRVPRAGEQDDGSLPQTPSNHRRSIWDGSGSTGFGTILVDLGRT